MKNIMKNEIPTAEKYLQEKYPMQDKSIITRFSKDLIDFTKLHVRAALEAASEKAQAKENPADYGTGEIWVDKNSILNAYPEKKYKVMTLDEQIQRTYEEWLAYKNANFANPEIVLWLSSILTSLIQLRI